MRVKWDTLKDKAIAYLVGNDFANVGRLGPYACLASIGNGKNWRDNMEELRQIVIRTIERWDVRRAKALVDLCPEIVPARCRGKIPRCYVADNANGDWVVEYE